MQSSSTTARFNPRTHIGCDYSYIGADGVLNSFNPRTHIGCDVWRHPLLISVQFQSTHPHRVRPCRGYHHQRHERFQSTHPHRVRLAKAPYGTLRRCFNPRTHIGCDENPADTAPSTKFQSTHPHRVRPKLLLPLQLLVMFQSTHPHRVRRCTIYQLVNHQSFNPRTHIGCDVTTAKASQ